MGDVGDAERLELALEDGADAGQQGDALGGEHGGGVVAEDGEAARLVAAGGDLGEQPVRREADRDGDPDLRLDAVGEAGEDGGGGRFVQGGGAAEVHDGFVDRERLHEGGEFAHEGAHVAGGGGVFGEVGADDDGVGAEFERLEHGLRAVDAVEAGDVAGGADDAAGAAADDHRQAREFRAVALLDAGEEGVAVDVGDGEVEQVGMRDDPAGAAERARLRRHFATAIAAEGGHQGGRNRIMRSDCRSGCERQGCP